MEAITCGECGQSVAMEGGEWVADRVCTSLDGHYVPCDQDMGHMTFCGDQAVGTFYGTAYCPTHLRIVTALDALAASTPADV